MNHVLSLAIIGVCAFWVLQPSYAGDSETGVFRVSEYGAVGDGVADDTKAIREAISAASSSGGVVQLAKGRYRVTDTLNIDASGVVLSGLSLEISSIIADGTDYPVVQFGNDSVKVSKVGLSSVGVHRTERGAPGVPNVWLAWANPAFVDQVTITEAGEGLTVGSTGAPDICGCISISRVWMGACRKCLVVSRAADVFVSHMYGGYSDIGVHLTDCANNIRITDCLFLTMRPEQGKHALVSDGGFMQEVKGTVFEETREELIVAKNTVRFFFNNNWLNGNPDSPMIRLEKVPVFQITGTRFGGSGTTCIELEQCARGVVTSNHMESSRGKGIDLIDCEHIEIANNQMGGNWTIGVHAREKTRSIGIRGNHITGAVAAIALAEDAGDHFIIKDNFLSKSETGAYIIDDSSGTMKIIKDNLEQ